jgi:23S rRNA (pseudouridine1915-N3)-methyltransferase
MKITLAAVVPRRSRSKADVFEELLTDYTTRAARYLPTESVLFETEATLISSLERNAGRTRPFVVLLDSRGKQLSSEEIATTFGDHRDQGTQRLVFAIGPADGWTEQSRRRADLLLSLGRITLPHQLARVVLAEQVYRALTILAGHPYHSGH